MKSKYLSVVIIGLVLLLAVLLWLFVFRPSTAQVGVVGEVHKHADFKVYLNGVAYNFSQDKYMSGRQNKTLSPFIHLHDGDGEVIHQHATGITLAMFFNSLGMKFNSTCFVLDGGQGDGASAGGGANSSNTGVSFCNSGDKTLKFFVNAQPNGAFGNYEPNDLDRILITYGNDTAEAVAQQLNSVTHKACIQSGKCPEQGVPENESSCLSGSDCMAVR